MHDYHKCEDTFVDAVYAADIARSVGAALITSPARLAVRRFPAVATMKRELDTRKESDDVFGRRLDSRETRGAAAASAVSGLATLAMEHRRSCVLWSP